MDLLPAILAATPRWLVVNKPAGWLTIPGRAGRAGHRGASPVLSEWADAEHGRVWVVHRLDRETTGVVLFARSAEDHREANAWFSSHSVRKVYHCLASGTPAMPVFRIAREIEGAHCATQVEVEESRREGFLGRVRPLTGRRHQIRIHLAEEGFPLWGDREYGGASEVPLAGAQSPIKVTRVALHASELTLPSGETFTCPWPEDFAGWVSRLKKEGAPK